MQKRHYRRANTDRLSKKRVSIGCRFTRANDCVEVGIASLIAYINERKEKLINAVRQQDVMERRC